MSSARIARGGPGAIIFAVVAVAVALVYVFQVRGPDGAARAGTDAESSAKSRATANSTRPTRASGKSAVGRFVYLYDVSESVHSGRSSDPFSLALQTLEPAISSLAELTEVMPEEHLVSTIGSLSLKAAPLCRIRAEPIPLFFEHDTTLAVEISKCVQRLIAAPSEKYTDLSGALAYAALSIGGENPALRGVVVFSDMEEDLAPGANAATPDLRDICVAVFVVVTDRIAHDPALIDSRRREWTQRLQSWHAKAVLYKTTLGFRAQDLQAFFRSCELR